MVLEDNLVQLEHWVGEHPQHKVLDEQLFRGVVLSQHVVQVPRQLHVIFAVLTVLSQIGLREVLTAFAQRSNDFLTFLTKCKLLGQFLERTAHSLTRDRSRHAQCVEVVLGDDAVAKRQDGPVERCVVAQQVAVLEVQCGQLHGDVVVAATDPVRFLAVDLVTKADHLKLFVPDVGLGGDLVQTEVLRVVGLEVKGYYSHRLPWVVYGRACAGAAGSAPRSLQF